MASRTIKKWITINGNHIPVYEDGSLGGVAQKFTANDGTSYTSHAEKASGETVDSLAKNLKDNYGLEIDSADKHNMSGGMNDEKVTMYDKDGNEYEGTYNRYSDGEREIVNIKKKEQTGQEEDSGKSISISDTVDMKPGSKIEIEQFGSIDGKSQGYKEFTLGPNGRWSSKDGEAFDNTSRDLAEHSKSEITGVQGHIRSVEIGQRSISDLDLSKMSDEQLKETAKNTLASGNAEATFALSQEAARRGWKSLNGPDNSKELEDAYKRGQVAPETLKAAGYTEGELAELSKAGRDDALKRVEEGRNKSTYIDPMGNLNQKKTRSAYEQNYNEDFRDMSKSQAREERLGKTETEISDNIRSQFSDKSDDELLTTSRNAYKNKFSREESKALNDELKSRGYDYIQGGWKKNRSSEKSIKVGDREVGVAKTKPASSEELYDKANAAYKKSEARSQKAELAKAKETGDYSGVFASTYLKMPISEIRSIGRQLGLSDFALSGNKSQIIADILRAKRKK